MITYRRILLFPVTFFSFSILLAQTGTVKGTVIDRQTGEPLPGATVFVAGTGVAADLDGKYSLQLPKGIYTVVFSYISYQSLPVENVAVRSRETVEVNAEMSADDVRLDEITVTAVRRRHSDLSVLSAMKAASVVMSGISSQAIARTQDRDAAEVVKRIPGISVIGDRFVVIRGLAQRYNNAWINGMALPSAEADARAFSFDMIPGTQIEQMMIVKTPAAEYPADYAGGFVLIRTKSVVGDNSIQAGYGSGIHSETHFRDFKRTGGGGSDWMGFDNGARQLKNVPSRMSNDLSANLAEINRITQTGFNNDWTVKTVAPLPDQRLNLSLNRSRRGERAETGLALALNYSYADKTVRNMDNAQFGVYSAATDEPVYRFKYTDQLYTTDVKWGGMANFLLLPKSKRGAVHRYEFRNLFNQLGRSRYTWREGWRNVSGYYEQQQEEYAYQSRTAYSGQLSGAHLFDDGKNDLDWNLGYAYSNRYQPDRRIVERQKDPSNGVYEYAVDRSEISRYFTALDESVFSGAVNYTRKINAWDGQPLELKTGVYGAYTVRSYRTRNFSYTWNLSGNTLPAGFETLPTGLLMSPEYGGAPDKIYIRDETDNTDNYDAANRLLAAYAAVNLPIRHFHLYMGLRFEHCATRMTAYTQIATDKKREDNYPYNNFFPSLNASCSLTRRSLLRLAYGVSVNRQELRELTASTYYDFDLFSLFSGNPDLKQATIHNLDLRYEWYPSEEDVVSLAVFFKHFRNPIELTFFEAGGAIQYSYGNALHANNFGVEIDARKSLDDAGLAGWTATLNVTLVGSSVHFEDNSRNHDRPMQGQSPYIINAGIFYRLPNGLLNAGLFYNRIGERIIGLGRTGGDSINNDIPDLYERSRNLVDCTFAVRLGKAFELRGAVRDIFAEPVEWVQYPKFTDAAGTVQERRQATRSFRPGRHFLLALSVTF
ncbi:MAG: outer membrane beta-barrel protein [Prevotellaceae bacterium]|jgi:TonB-dependent receptor|nr:outer membrane beta-barrel protein [Prevotellaceae bacterium]